jgi:hypothetical protein
MTPVASGQSSAGVTRPDGFVVGRPNDGPPDNRLAASDGVPGTPLRPGEWYPAPPKPTDDEKKKSDKHSRHVVSDRDDWGLPSKQRGAAAISRPIRVECHADRLVIVSDYGPTNNKVIPLGRRTSSAVDPLISGIWEHMDTWGIAGSGMYWRPMLIVSVAPDAEDRYAELASLLGGSGLTLQRR